MNPEQDGFWRAAQECLGPEGLLSVIMPAFNLAGAIARNIEVVQRLLDGHLPYEIVVVDDGSRDGTGQAVAAVCKRHATVKLLSLPENVGKGAALRRGFMTSRGTHILLLDADLDLSPHLIGRFFEIMRKKNAAIVIGSKRHPDSEIDYPWRRRFASAVYYGLVKLLIGLPVTDTQTGMKLFRRDALQWAAERMLVKRFAFDLELLAVAHERGFRVREAPIRMHYGNKIGSLTWANIRSVMKDTLAIFYRMRIVRYYRSVTPGSIPDPPPGVSVIIACPRPSPYLTEALRGLASQTLAPLEILVLPDEPDPNYAWPDKVRVLPTGPVRPADKRNLGLRHARGDLVAFLDDDAYPNPHWLSQALQYFSTPEVAAVGGPALTPPGDPLMSQAGGRVYANWLVAGGYRYRYTPDRVRDVDDLPSCNLLVRTEVMRRLEGFNTRYWPGEDTILCSEIVHRLGLRMVYDPWTTVYHHRRPLFAPHLRQIGRYARHRGFFARRFPQTSRRPGYMLPSALLLGLVGGALLSAFWPGIRPLYFGTLLAYLLVVAIGSWHPKPVLWLATAAGIVATHLTYGARFLQGLLSREMPRQAGVFDHASETASPKP